MDWNSFTFAGKHSLDDMGLYTLLTTQSLFAEPKRTAAEWYGMDGERDYSTHNPQERLFFKPRLIGYECHFAADSTEEFYEKARRIGLWLATAGKAKLMPDGEPDIYYMAQAVNLYALDNITGMSGSFPLVFRCDPYRYERREDCAVLEEGTGKREILLGNRGYHVPPVITITGSAKEITLKNGEKELVVAEEIDRAELVVDCRNMTVTKDGVAVNHSARGSFFELSPGANRILVETAGTVSAQVRWRTRYV